ncbi:MAG: STAS domain-containing protein [Lachnospiraceae bacterium]|nr:STAS domain-containing protein [Lachnospiraceae bacterium]
MLNIEKRTEGTNLTVALDGRLDTISAPQLEGELRSTVDGITKLTLDLKGLEYISSAGLRVLLSAQKVMNKQGEMTITNANDEVMEIFEVTGFIDILNIEE